jgi:hypothetical protein
MNSKSELDSTVFDKDLDRILPNGTTRRQFLEKLRNDPRPGLRGEAKWAALRALQEEGRRRREQQQTDDLNILPTA